MDMKLFSPFKLIGRYFILIKLTFVINTSVPSLPWQFSMRLIALIIPISIFGDFQLCVFVIVFKLFFFPPTLLFAFFLLPYFIFSSFKKQFMLMLSKVTLPSISL
jgi:hypothetical protein